jgi:hypothetical protein
MEERMFMPTKFILGLLLGASIAADLPAQTSRYTTPSMRQLNAQATNGIVAADRSIREPSGAALPSTKAQITPQNTSSQANLGERVKSALTTAAAERAHATSPDLLLTNVTFSVRERRVLVQGTVPTREDKERIESRLREVHGVEEVQSGLQVSSASNQGASN